jgi:hypothetical protein
MNSSNKFQLEIKKLFWRGEPHEHDRDLCLHGNVFVKIGDTVLDCGLDEGVMEGWAVSAGAYRMLKSLYKNHSNHTQDSTNQLLPCCGHFMCFDEKGELDIGGCNNGVDWSVVRENGNVTLTAKNKNEEHTQVTIPFEEYREIIFKFADEVKAFYDKSEPKFPQDELEIKTYVRFWEDFSKFRLNSERQKLTHENHNRQ